MSGLRSILSLLCCTALVAVNARAQDSTQWLTSLDEATTLAESSNRLILVDLYADWCHWCKRLESDVFSSAEFQRYAKKFVLLRVDTEDDAEGTRLQARFSAFSLPTTLLLDHRLVEYGKVQGYAPTTRYIGVIEREIAEFRALEIAYEQFVGSDDARALTTLAEEFHQRGEGGRASDLYRRLLETAPQSEDEANWTRLSLADALRIDEQYDAALEVVSEAQAGGTSADSQDILERLELIQARILLDRGDCQAAITELHRFITSHPKSELLIWAQRTLNDLETDQSTCA